MLTCAEFYSAAAAAAAAVCGVLYIYRLWTIDMLAGRQATDPNGWRGTTPPSSHWPHFLLDPTSRQNICAIDCASSALGLFLSAIIRILRRRLRCPAHLCPAHPAIYQHQHLKVNSLLCLRCALYYRYCAARRRPGLGQAAVGRSSARCYCRAPLCTGQHTAMGRTSIYKNA